jgi:hypothetical protein
MHCYADFAPSRDASFAIGNVIILPSFLGAALIRRLCSHWRRIMPVKSFSGYLSISYRTFYPLKQ